MARSIPIAYHSGMTRILVLSDLHLELSSWDFPERFPAHDVAIFAGDVDVPLRNSVRKLARTMAYGALRGSQVVLVPGNHEYYRGEMESELAESRLEARDLGIHLLDCDELVIGDLRILGATLWTDYELYGDPKEAMKAARRSMNDHRLIVRSGSIFSPDDALAIHRRHLAWLEERLGRTHPRTVVVTHHGPTFSSVHPKYAGDALNPAFSSDLEALIRRHSPALWIHGHTHSSMDYTVGATRVLCNPKGYGPRVAGGAPENPDFD